MRTFSKVFATQHDASAVFGAERIHLAGAGFRTDGSVTLCLAPWGTRGSFQFADYLGLPDANPFVEIGRLTMLDLNAEGSMTRSAMIGSPAGTRFGQMRPDDRGNLIFIASWLGPARFGRLEFSAPSIMLARRTEKGDFRLLSSPPIRDHILAVDGSGNMYVTTHTSDTAIDLGGHLLPIFRTHFIKFTSEGRVAWVASQANADPAPAPGFPHVPSLFVTHAVVDAAGHPVFALTGGPAQFGDVNLTNLPPTLAKFDREEGRLLWAKSLHPGPATPVNIYLGALKETPDGGFLVGGTIGLVDSRSGVTNPALPSIGPTPITRGRGNPVGFVGRLDAQGDFLWANVLYLERLTNAFGGGIGVSTLAAGPSGTIYLAGGSGCGTWLGDIQLGSNCGSRTDADGFVAALTPEGRWLWAKTFGGSKQEFINHLGVDAAENLYIAGSTESPDAKFDSFTVAATGQSSAFLAKLSSGRSAVVNPERTLEGDLRFQVLGTAGLTNRVEFSTNLVTWTLFTEFVAQRASTTVLVPASPTGPPRYYRASAR